MFNDMLQQLMARARDQQQQQYAGVLGNAAQQPIPGFTGPAGSGAGIPTPGGVGMAPPQQPLPGGTPTMGNHMMPGQALQPFMASGPYGQQAMQMAGLLGPGGPGMGMPQRPVGGAQINAMMGDKARMPMYRPVGK